MPLDGESNSERSDCNINLSDGVENRVQHGSLDGQSQRMHITIVTKILMVLVRTRGMQIVLKIVDKMRLV